MGCAPSGGDEDFYALGGGALGEGREKVGSAVRGGYGVVVGDGEVLENFEGGN